MKNYWFNIRDCLADEYNFVQGLLLHLGYRWCGTGERFGSMHFSSQYLVHTTQAGEIYWSHSLHGEEIILPKELRGRVDATQDEEGAITFYLDGEVIPPPELV